MTPEETRRAEARKVEERYAALWLAAVVVAGGALTVLMLLRSPTIGDDALRAGEAEVGVALSEWSAEVPKALERAPSRLPDQSLGAALRDRARSQGATKPLRCVERAAPDLGLRTTRIGCAYEGEDWADVYYWTYDAETGDLTPLNALAVQITPPSAG